MIIPPQSPDAYEWTPVRHWSGEGRSEGAGAEMAMVLTVTSSLTRFIERRYGLRLELALHDQCVDRLNAYEAGLLEVAAGDACLRRTVSLLNRQSVMFDAESVLPLDGLPADLMAELEAGQRPLANLLLERGLSLSRSDLCVGKHVAEHGDALWARRSVLRSASGTRALVTEYFHPEIWRRIERRY